MRNPTLARTYLNATGARPKVTPRPTVIESLDASAAVLATSRTFVKNPKTLQQLAHYVGKLILLTTKDAPSTSCYKDQEIPNSMTSTKGRTTITQEIPHKIEILLTPRPILL